MDKHLAWGRRRGGRRTSEREELEGAPRILRRIRLLGKALASEKIRRVSTPGDVDHIHAELGQSIEPASLLMGHVALLLEFLKDVQPHRTTLFEAPFLRPTPQGRWAQTLKKVPEAEFESCTRQRSPDTEAIMANLLRKECLGWPEGQASQVQSS